MGRTMLPRTAFASLALAIASCASTPPDQSSDRSPDRPSDPPAEAPGELGRPGPPRTRTTVPSDLRGTWTLATMDGRSVAMASGSAQRPTLDVQADGTVGGFGGVNQWGSRIDLTGLEANRFEITAPFSTMMAGEPASMRLESDFLRALGQARTYELRVGTLVLLGADGRELLGFRRR